MTDYTIRSEQEAKTLELLDGFEATDDYYTTIQCLKQVFRASWVSSMSVGSIRMVALGLTSFELTPEDTQAVLTRMVRAKVLRSRRHRDGTRHYEVNY